MITADRYGKALPADIPGDVDWQWSMRVMATHGVYSSHSAWTPYEVPPDAIVSGNRQQRLDGGTAACTVELLPGFLPDTTEPLAYYELQVDQVDAAGNRWPYHTGPIDTIDDSTTLVDGAMVEIERIEAFGVMNRTKGLRLDAVALWPDRDYYGNDAGEQMTGIAQAVTTFVSRGGDPTTTILGAVHTVDATVGTGDFPGIVISANKDFSSPLVYGAGADQYTITAPADGTDLVINWGASVAVDTYYVRYFIIDRFIVRREWGGAGTNPAIIRLPHGDVAYGVSNAMPKRRWFDTFQTYAAAGCTDTVITVRDPTAFINTDSLIAVTGGPTEYLIWTKSDGSEVAKAIESTDGSGVITTASFVDAPAEGDPIRVGTCEPVRAWDTHNNGVPVLFYTTSGYATQHKRGQFALDPRNAVMTSLLSKHWLSASSGVWPSNSTDNCLYIVKDSTTIGAVSGTDPVDDNRTENFLYYALRTFRPVIAPGEFDNDGTGTGGFVKNLEMTNTDLAGFVENLSANGLPPNAYILDTPAGHVRCDAFTQADRPDLYLGRIKGLTVVTHPEPRTGVAVVSRGAKHNMISKCNPQLEAGAWTNGSNMFLSNGAGAAAATITGASGAVTLNITPLTPQAFPNVIDVVITGTVGAVQAKVQRRLTTSPETINSTKMVEGFGFVVLGENGLTIDGSRISDAMVACGGVGVDYHDLVLTFWPDDTGATAIDPSITGIAVNGDIEAAWTSYITNDITGSIPTDWNTENDEGFGNIWWQRDSQVLASYRFANTALAQRLLPLWASGYATQRHRIEVLSANQITQDECRDRAEMWLDEYIRQSKEYRVSMILDPRIAIGDTIGIALTDDTTRNLFVFGMTDDGHNAQLELVDYAA